MGHAYNQVRREMEHSMHHFFLLFGIVLLCTAVIIFIVI